MSVKKIDKSERAGSFASLFQIIKKADIILFVVLVVISLGLWWFSLADQVSGQKALVTVDGEEYGIYSLSEDKTVEIKQHGHTNKITIKNGTVQMTYSDCKNQNCVETGKIDKTSQTIVCLPNKVMIQIVGGEEAYDAIAK